MTEAPGNQRVFSTSEVLMINRQIKRMTSLGRRDPATGCLIWTGCENGDGYGYANLAGKRYLVHRLAWMLANHVDPGSDQICHTCDVRLCYEASHLFRGTPADNMRDMKEKGRSRAPGARRFTDAQVRNFRERYANGTATPTELAREVGMHVTSMRALLYLRTYREVA